MDETLANRMKYGATCRVGICEEPSMRHGLCKAHLSMAGHHAAMHNWHGDGATIVERWLACRRKGNTKKRRG